MTSNFLCIYIYFIVESTVSDDSPRIFQRGSIDCQESVGLFKRLLLFVVLSIKVVFMTLFSYTKCSHNLKLHGEIDECGVGDPCSMLIQASF